MTDATQPTPSEPDLPIDPDTAESASEAPVTSELDGPPELDRAVQDEEPADRD